MPYKRKDKRQNPWLAQVNINGKCFCNQERSHQLGGRNTEKCHLVDTHDIFR